jgi:hypothetical protein
MPFCPPFCPPERQGNTKTLDFPPNSPIKSLEQYKHPCLIADLKFRESVTVEEELVGV